MTGTRMTGTRMTGTRMTGTRMTGTRMTGWLVGAVSRELPRPARGDPRPAALRGRGSRRCG
ncbi:pentapeptide repeat-containing protein [Nocardia sp. NPDC058058]|uniref:pentapeptide repeat-containing protein n=1 Tax=Nocardia sp. NPDC058058 TaxID=3346317 RepID=UPI0036DD39AC